MIKDITLLMYILLKSLPRTFQIRINSNNQFDKRNIEIDKYV